MFAGCTTHNNGVTTKNVHPARVIDGHTTYRSNALDRNGLGILNAPGYRHPGYFGTDGYRTNNYDGYRTNNYYGNGITRYSGPTTTPGYGMTGYGTTGTTGTNGTGMYSNTTGMTGTSGYSTYGTTPSRTGVPFGTTGTTGFGSSASSYNGTVGTSSLSNTHIHGLSVTNNHVLQLGNLTIVGSKHGTHATSYSTGFHGMSGTTTTGMGTTTGTATAGRSGTTSRVLTVTDTRAVEAIDRVNRMLSTPSKIRAESNTLAKDLSYILKKASETSPSGTTAATHTGTSHR